MQTVTSMLGAFRGGLRLACIWLAFAISLASILGCVSTSSDETASPHPADGLRDRTVAPAIPSQPGVVPAHVVVISIAGLRPAHYGAGAESSGLAAELSVMPAVSALAASGGYTDGMTTVMPAAPYPAHATVVTGRIPTRHGVVGGELLSAAGLSSDGMAAAERIEGRTLWLAARASGIAVAALAWPSTLGAPIELLMPDPGAPTGTDTWYELIKAGTTPWLYERLALFDASLPDVAWPTPEAYDALVTQAACEIARQPKTPGLWLLYYGQGATSLALFGPGTEDGLDGMRRVDVEIEKLLACFAEAGLIGTTAFLLTGDRSFLPVHSVAQPNVVLDRAGLLTKGPQHLGVPVTGWDALARSYGGSAVVYAVDERAARLARSALAAVADESGAFRVVSAAELASLSGDPEAWFALEAAPGFVLSNDVRGAAVEATDFRGGGGYLPTAAGSRVGFVAWGAGIRNRVRLPEMSLVDVGPTASALLGVSLSDADGRPITGLLGRRPAAAGGTPE